MTREEKNIQAWIEVTIKGYIYNEKNFCFYLCKLAKQNLMAVTKMSEAEFERLVKAYS